MKTNKFLAFEMNKILKEDIDKFADDFKLVGSLKGKSFLITGATGLLGSCMVYCLQALNRRYNTNIKITAVVRNQEKARRLFGEDEENLYYYVFDFSESNPFNPEIKADYIVHFASPTASRYFVDYPVETMITGLQGTRTILDYAKNEKIESAAYISSLEVYGTITDDSQPLSEERQGYIDPINTRSSYPIGKRASECLCHAYASEYGVPVKVARLAQTFGAGVAKDDNRVFAQFARNIINNENILLHTKGELCRSYCYTMDAISGILYVLLKGIDGEAYNVANESSYISIIDMAKFLCDNFNENVHPVIELKENMGYSPTTKLKMDVSKLKKLGWNPAYDLRLMFDRLIKSLRN